MDKKQETKNIKDEEMIQKMEIRWSIFVDFSYMGHRIAWKTTLDVSGSTARDAEYPHSRVIAAESEKMEKLYVCNKLGKPIRAISRARSPRERLKSSVVTRLT